MSINNKQPTGKSKWKKISCEKGQAKDMDMMAQDTIISAKCLVKFEAQKTLKLDLKSSVVKFYPFLMLSLSMKRQWLLGSIAKCNDLLRVEL